MSKSEAAAAAFLDGFSCSQAVFTAFSDDFGLDRQTALKMSQALGGGMGHLGQTCGALSGAFLAIGLKYGRTRAEDTASRDRTYAVMKALNARFVARHGGMSCPALLGCDLGTAEGMKEAQEKNLFGTKCAAYVRDAAELVEELLK